MRRQARSNKTDTAQPPVSAPPDLRSMPVIALEREAGQQAGSPILAGTPNEIDPDLRHQMISEAAYQLYVDGGYRDGHELDDWLQAEAEVDRVLANQIGGFAKSDANVRASVMLLAEFHNEIMAAGYLPEEFTADVLDKGNDAGGNGFDVVRVIRSVPHGGSYGIMFREDAERQWHKEFRLALCTQQFGKPISMQPGEGSASPPSVASSSDNPSGPPEKLSLFPQGTKQ